MAKKLSAEDMAAIKSKGGVIKKKPKPKNPTPPAAGAKPIPLENSSAEMKAAVAAAQQAAEAAIKTSQVVGGLVEESIQSNKQLIADVVEVISGDKIIGMKINRDSRDLMSTVDFIRA